nr:hypothetical protein [Tanacetum cinerariifolium]
SIPRPPPKPPDDEFNAGEEIQVVMNDKDEDVDYSSFIFVIFAKVFSLLSAESEDIIFDPAQNFDFFGSDQIQTTQYPDVHPPSPNQSEEVCQAKEDLINSIQTFLEKFDCIPFEERPKIYLQTWYNFFKFWHAKPEDSNELFQKLLEDLKELAEYDNSPSRDRPIFLNNNENHSDQNKEYLENPSKEIDVSYPNQEKEEPLQDFDIHKLIKECCVEASEEQKQSMEDTMLELVKICQEKEFLYIHDNVDDLIESALNSKLLLINANSQRLEKEQQEVKNVVEQPTERKNRIKSLQNFRVIHKSSISFKNTSQISSIHAVAPILPTKEPEHSLSMGYKHLSITPETEYDEVTESNAENILPIPSECEVTLEDEIECDVPDKDNCSLAFTTFSNPLFNDNDDLDSSDNESLPDEDVLADEFKEEIRLIESLLYDNSSPRPPEELNVEIADTIVESIPSLPILVQDEEADLFLSDNSIPPGIKNFADDPEGEILFLEELLIDDSILSHESFDSNFEDSPSIPRPPSEPPDAETDAGKEIPVVMNDKDEFDDDYFTFMIVI